MSDVKVINMDDYKPLNEKVETLLGKNYVVCFIPKDRNEIHTLVPQHLSDQDLVFMIQCLTDRRQMRWMKEIYDE